MPDVAVAVRSAVERSPAARCVVPDCGRHEMLVVMALCIGQHGSEQDRAGDLRHEAPRTEEQRAETEEQLAGHEAGVEEKYEPAGLHGEQREDLERVVE